MMPTEYSTCRFEKERKRRKREREKKRNMLFISNNEFELEP